MTFDKMDAYIVVISVIITIMVVSTITAAFKGRFPSVQTLTDLAMLANTKGGIVILLVCMWFITLSTTIAFGVWIIIKGVDPQHGVVITILGMLISQAFGNVNGALFKTMTGEEPKITSGAATHRLFVEENTTNSLTPSGG